MNPRSHKYFWLTFFSIAMGFMESAIVVYLRELYYPNGFQFPLVIIEPSVGLTEILREAATVIMLIGIAQLSAKTASQRFAYFIYAFAIWDLFYYIFLKALIDWPESLFTWDILFLIPVPWVGPVIAPCIVCIAMILLAGSIEYYSEKGRNTKVMMKEWILWIAGSLVVIISFVWDYFHFISHSKDIVKRDPDPDSDHLFYEISSYIPEHFEWGIFFVGIGLIVTGIFAFINRMQRQG